MRKIIYTLILLSFVNLSFAQGNYLMNTNDPDMVPLTGTNLDGILGINLCVSQGIYTITPVIINLNNTSEVAPADLEYELISTSQTNTVTLPTQPPVLGSIQINLEDLRNNLNMTNRQRRIVSFAIKVKEYPNSDPRSVYNNIDRVFNIELSNDEPLTGNSVQDITISCGNQARLSNIITNSIYGYISYYDNQGNLVTGNANVNEGDVYLLYPRFSSIIGNNGGTCNISPLQITIGTVSETNAEPYVGPRLGNNYGDISVCDVNSEIIIPLLSYESSFPLDHTDGTYRLRRSNSTSIALTNPVFVNGVFSHFLVDLSTFYSSSTYDSSYRVQYIPSNPLDSNGNPTQLCSDIYSNSFFIDITNEFTNVFHNFDRGYFTNGLDDLDYDGVQEDELTYKAMYNLFLRGQQGYFNNEGLTAAPDLQGFLQYLGYTYMMYKDDGAGNKVQITTNAEYNSIVAELSDLEVNCNEVFYFKVTSNCGDYHFDNDYEEYKTLTINLRDLITTYTNPDQYFCSADDPTVLSLSLNRSVTGNPLTLWGSKYGNDLLYDAAGNGVISATTPLEEGDEFWIQEFGVPTFTANCTGNLSNMYSSQRFYIKVHIVNNCSPETGECLCNSFELERGDKYIVSAWVKEDQDKQVVSYENAKLDLTFLEGDQVKEAFSFSPSGEIIEGWQRVVGEFFVPITATKVRIDLNNADAPETVPFNISDYFVPRPPQVFGIQTYTINFLNDDFSNCGASSTYSYRILSNGPLEENIVYRYTPLFGYPPVPNASSGYITVTNETNNVAPLLGTVTNQATISCNQFSQLIIANPEPLDPQVVNLDPYFDDLPSVFPGVTRRYDVVDVGNEFTNCDGIPTTQIKIQSSEELLPNKVYKLSTSRGLPNNVPLDLLSPYIKVSNPTIARRGRSRFVEKVATISCDALADLFIITEPEPNERVDVFYDDIRIHPFNGNMKSFVYDPITQRLMAELDENNYATMYEYDEEGGLVRVKKETEKGVFTIQETRSKSATKE